MGMKILKAAWVILLLVMLPVKAQEERGADDMCWMRLQEQRPI